MAQFTSGLVNRTNRFIAKEMRQWNHEKWVESLGIMAKADLSVLRWRIPDVVRVCSDRALEEITNLDYITALNSLVYSSMFEGEFNMLCDLGVFSSRDNLIKVGKLITPIIKRVRCNEHDRQPYAELHSLAGYQQAEPDGWDMRSEVLALAESGDQHGLVESNWPRTFNRGLLAISEHIVDIPAKYMTFDAYISSGKWITSGSSSIGHVEWEKDGRTGHFKARKNMLTCLFTADELVALVHSWDKTLESKAFVKPELAKRRIAVASNIESYLNDSYVLYLMGHGYKNWKGVTLDETRNQEQTRVRETMSRMLKGEWALPFDYAAFDRQPTTDEIIWIVEYMTRNVDVRARPYVLNMLKAYRNSYISYQDAGSMKRVTVTGGLPSGVRPTSLIGNVWNAVMCEVAIDITNTAMHGMYVTYRKIRGDDSYFVSPTLGPLVMLRLALAAINAKGSNAKFGICSGYVEFLRTNITGVAARGWVCRTIPTLSQRKPWNPEPWSPLSETETLVRGVETLERRYGRELKQLHQVIRSRFARVSKISSRWLTIPRRAGGFGLYADQGWRSRSSLPTASRQIFDVQPTADLPLPSWISAYKNIDPASYTKAFLSLTIATDDIPGTTSALRQPYLQKLRNMNSDWYKIQVPVPVGQSTGHTLTSYDVVPQTKRYIYENPADGKTLMEFISEYGIASLAVEMPTMMTIIRDRYYQAYVNIKSYTRRGWHLSDAIDLAMGEKPIARAPKISPLLNG